MLHKGQNLSKKLERWVPKLLNDNMKTEQVRTSEECLDMVRRHSMSMWTTLSLWMRCPFTHLKQSSRAKSGLEKLKRASLGLSWPKSMSQEKSRWCWAASTLSIIYTNSIPRGKTVHAQYTMLAPIKFLRVLKQWRMEIGGFIGITLIFTPSPW
jgi:hypothetical protein